MKKKDIAKIMLVASTVTVGTTVAQDKVQASELNNNENFVDNIQSRAYNQRGQVINAPSSLRVRSSASTSSNVIGYLTNGTTVNIISENGQWYRIEFNGSEGYVHGDYIKLITTNSESTNISTGKVINISSYLNVRQSPTTTSSIVATLKNGTSVDVYKKDGEWYKIKSGNISGYVHSDYLLVSNNTNNNENNNSDSESGGNGSQLVNKKGKVINVSSGLNVRQAASTNSAIIKTLKNGDTFDISFKSGDWYNIKTGNVNGYVHGDYVEEINDGTTDQTKPTIPTPEYEKITGKVINVVDNLRVRTGPGTEYSILGYLLNGENVKITGESGSWYKIDYKGKVGYAHKDYIQKDSNVTIPPTTDDSNESKPNPNPTPEVTTRYGQVVNISTNLRVRSEASTNSTVLGYLLNGQRVTIIGESAGFYKIDFNGGYGFVSTEYVKIVEQDLSGDYQQTFEKVLSIMKEHIGSPYVWGGTGEMLTTSLLNTLKNRYPNETARGMYARAELYVNQGYRAFDCSGLMQWGFAQVGIHIGRSTWHQIEDGYEVSLDNIRPGDLLFYSSLEHVGMYIGNGQWIEAPNQNENVRVANVPWSNIGRARRVIN